MKKILILSDSHGNTRGVLRAAARHPDASAVYFLGDGLRDADALEEEYPRLRVYRVRGNCDFASFDPVEGVSVEDGVVIFYTHGHLYGVKSGLGELAAAAKSRGADVALFGHTHDDCCETFDGLTLFNPGSAGVRSSMCGVLTVDKGRASFAHEVF